MAEQLFFEPLMEPSLHRNRSPSQRSIPPFLPEQGVLPAQADELNTLNNNRQIDIQPWRIELRTMQHPIEVMAQ
jgi:hypothetical protein